MSSACGVVVGEVVDDAGLAGVHVAAAQVLGGDDLAGGRLHQRRPAEEDRALVAHDDGLVAHRGHVGAAGRARSHHGGDLGDAARAHRGLVEEDPAEVLAVGEDLVLPRQERAAGVDQVDAGQPVRQRDLLRPQVLLHRHRVVRAALDGGVVGHHHALAAADPADAGDDARPPGVSFVVHALGRQRARSPGTGCRDRAAGRPGPGQQLAARHVPGPGRLGAAQRPHPEPLPQVGDQFLVLRTGRRGRTLHGHRQRHLSGLTMINRI